MSRLGLSGSRSIINGIMSSESDEPERVACLSNVRVGTEEYGRLPVRFRPHISSGLLALESMDGLMGNDVLMQFAVTIDLAKGLLYLTRDAHAPASLQRFVTLGFQFARDNDGFFTIMSVWTPSLAAAAHLVKGEQVRNISGRSTALLDEDSFSRPIHGNEG